MNSELALTPFSMPLGLQTFLVIGSNALSEKVLQLIAMISLKQPVTVLDCGNRSNMYTVAKLIRPYTRDPVSVMSHIQLSRAFTCYQVLAMLQMVVDSPDHNPIAVLDLLATFLDEDVNLADSQRLLTHSLNCLEKLSQRAPVIISTRSIPAISIRRETLLEQLREHADVCWEEPVILPPKDLLQPALFS